MSKVFSFPYKLFYTVRNLSPYTMETILNPALPPNPNRKEAEQQTLPAKADIWDPGNEPIRADQFENENKKLNKKFEQYKKHPRTPLRNLLLLSIPIFLLIGVLLWRDGRQFVLNTLGDDSEILGVVLVPAMYYFWKVWRLQIDLIKYIIAKEFGWIY